MKEFAYTITDPEGIHARPAGQLVKMVKQFGCATKLTFNGKTADCRKIFAVMSLGVKKGNEIVLTFDGDDEEEAYEKISEFMKENL